MLGVEELRHMTPSERSAKINNEMKSAQEAANARRAQENQNRNEACFRLPQNNKDVPQSPEPLVKRSSPQVSPTTDNALKRDYCTMTKEELMVELTNVELEESLLKKKKKNIEFNLDYLDAEENDK